VAEIFISYRRDDSRDFAGAIRDKLGEAFERDRDGDALIYQDANDPIPYEPWPRRITDELESSHVVLVIIGPKWLTVKRGGVRRLEQKEDWVRKEIEFAVRTGKKLIPVCVGGANLPERSQLPKGQIRKLLDKRAEFIDAGKARRAVEYELLVQRVFRELPSDSKARRNADSPDPVTSSQIVCRYELTGLAEATGSTGKADWKGGHSFELVEPALMNGSLAFVERALLEADPSLSRIVTKIDRQPTPDGAIFFIDGEDRPEHMLNAVAKKARDASSGFLNFFREFTLCDERGTNWIIDIRIVVTSGSIWKTNGRDVNTGRPMTRYFGQPLITASALLRYRDNKGRPLVRRGDVVAVSRKAPKGFDEYRSPPKEWPQEGSELVADARKVLGCNNKIWLARRAPETSDYFRIRTPAVEMLKRRTLTTDKKARDLLNHVPPSNYGQIAKLAKADARFCIIVGDPGAGKTLCALRLVAEMMYVDGFDVSIPPVTTETWKRLASQSNPGLVILLDDAFGKTKAVNDDDLHAALEALAGSEDGETSKGDKSKAGAESFLEQRADRRPALIITVRQKIWQTACEKNESWERTLGKYKIEIRQESYSPNDRMALFRNYWKDERDNLRESSTRLEHAVAEISHPLSIRDFAMECADDGLGTAVKKVPMYHARDETDVLNRYAKQLMESGGLMHLWHFLGWAFGGTLLDKKEVESLYRSLGSHLGFSSAQASKLWQTNEDRPHWGTWMQNGYFTANHPLREEAIDKFFRDEDQSDLIEAFFEALLAARGDAGGDGLKLAAFAAPKANGRIGRHRKRAIELAAKDPNSEAARVLASSIGQAFRSAAADRSLAWHPATRVVLVAALKSILASANNAAFGVAFAALCDGFPKARALPPYIRDLKEFALRRLKPVCELKKNKVTTIPRAQMMRTQNIDHSMWAIASNFSRVPDEFRELFASFVRHGDDDWLRLRAVEAAADYIAEIKETATKAGRSFENYIDEATDVSQPDIMRRGVAGAVEANFDKLEFAPERITEWLDSVNERHNYGFLEWVIWAAGEHLKNYTSPQKPDKKFADALLKLARHEDARVRKWLATALAESDVTNESDFLRSIMTRLAHDEDDIVRDVALDFFLAESEEAK
jgi:hypothetical protein